MKTKTRQFPEIVSFRLTESDRQDFENLLTVMNVTKSEFLRKRVRNILLTLKNVEK